MCSLEANYKSQGSQTCGGGCWHPDPNFCRGCSDTHDIQCSATDRNRERERERESKHCLTVVCRSLAKYDVAWNK